MKYFERDDVVLVRSPAGSSEEGQVVLDTGQATIVVTRNDEPAHTRRVARDSVSAVNGAASVKPPAPTPQERPLPSPTALKCLESPHGWCAMQIQTRPLTQGELVDGVWSICGEWMQSRTKPTRRAPTCPACRRCLKLTTEKS